MPDSQIGAYIVGCHDRCPEPEVKEEGGPRKMTGYRTAHFPPREIPKLLGVALSRAQEEKPISAPKIRRWESTEDVRCAAVCVSSFPGQRRLVARYVHFLIVP